MKVLVTGFEPFGRWRESGINPSQRVVEALAAALPPEIDLRAAVLPAVFASAGPRLHALIDEHDPAAILLLGQGGGGALRVERVALNLDDIPGRHDNAGETREEQPIDHDGPAAYVATVPVRELVRRLNEEGVPAVESLSAGTFLCNHVFYVARRSCEQTHRSAQVGFIHLPLLPEQAAAEAGRERPASMALETQVRGVRLALAFLAGSDT
jgi:pyroglutamyl-peptidase